MTTLLLVNAFFFLIFPTDAFAYLDPRTGFFVIQAVVAVVAGSLLAVKMYWFKLKSLFTRGKSLDDKKSE